MSWNTAIFATGAAAIIAAVAALWWRARVRPRRAQARREDVLKHLCKIEAEGRRPTLASVAGVLRMSGTRAASMLEDMAARGLAEFSAGEIKLTDAGRKAGMHIIRAHRLWECYLAGETGLRAGEWHRRAEHREHRMTPAEADELAVLLGNPTHDPHGDPIPTADGHLDAGEARPLASLADGESAILAHIEDEPASLYQRLVSQRLQPGMALRMIDQTDGTVRFSANGRDYALETILANQIEVLPPTGDEPETRNLASLALDDSAVVLGLAPGCRGQERRRLLDLGFVAGTPVSMAMGSPSGEPTAYRVRGTLIALRREQARQILIKNMPPTPS